MQPLMHTNMKFIRPNRSIRIPILDINKNINFVPVSSPNWTTNLHRPAKHSRCTLTGLRKKNWKTKFCPRQLQYRFPWETNTTSLTRQNSFPSDQKYMEVEQRAQMRSIRSILTTQFALFSKTRKASKWKYRKELRFWAKRKSSYKEREWDLTTGFLSLIRDGLSRSSLWNPRRSPDWA